MCSGGGQAWNVVHGKIGGGWLAVRAAEGKILSVLKRTGRGWQSDNLNMNFLKYTYVFFDLFILCKFSH